MPNLPTSCISLIGPGDPIWHGRPHMTTILSIQGLTKTLEDGTRYYRRDSWSPWIRLRQSRGDYAILNRRVQRA